VAGRGREAPGGTIPTPVADRAGSRRPDPPREADVREIVRPWRCPLLLATYCVLVLAASIAGGLLPTLVRLDHARMQIALSLVAGVMFGVGVIHMLPHAIVLWQESPAVLSAGGPDLHGGLDPIMLAVLLGFLVMFLLERFLAFHQHEPATEEGAANRGGHRHGRKGGHSHAGHHHPAPTRSTSWLGALVGLAVHTILSGVALAASVQAALDHDPAAILAGFGVFLGVVLHKPFDAMTISMLMRSAGISRGKILLANAGFAMMVPVGIGVFELGIAGTSTQTSWTALALAFSAGTFLCIALSDLLPELHFHDHDRLKLTGALILGIAIAWGTGWLEKATHQHDHGGAHGHDHSHDHDHAH